MSNDQAAFRVEDRRHNHIRGTDTHPAPRVRPGNAPDGMPPIIHGHRTCGLVCMTAMPPSGSALFWDTCCRTSIRGKSGRWCWSLSAPTVSPGTAWGHWWAAAPGSLAPGLPIYGTLDEPVHAVNLAATLKEIDQAYREPLVVAVDACLGQAWNVGTVSIGRGPLHPGTGVHKDLPQVGEVFISGVVNVGGFMEFLVLQNTRLCLVMQLADCIARALVLVCTVWLQRCASAAASDACAPELQACWFNK